METIPLFPEIGRPFLWLALSQEPCYLGSILGGPDSFKLPKWGKSIKKGPILQSEAQYGDLCILYPFEDNPHMPLKVAWNLTRGTPLKG